MALNTERYGHIERRSGQACTILATMTLASATVCFFGQAIPEMLLNAATGALIGGIIGLTMFTVIQLHSIVRR